MLKMDLDLLVSTVLNLAILGALVSISYNLLEIIALMEAAGAG